MKLGSEIPELDAIDLQIIQSLQEQGRIPHVKLGEQVGLSAPSVIERVKKLEDGGIITGYHASVDARRLGKDVTAFIGVSISHPRLIGLFERDRRPTRRRARMPSRHRRAHAAAEGEDRRHRVARTAHQHDPLDRGSGAYRNDGGAVDPYRTLTNFAFTMREPEDRGQRPAAQRHTASRTDRRKTSGRSQTDITMKSARTSPTAGTLRPGARARRLRRRLRGQYQGRRIARHRPTRASRSSTT